MEKDTPTLDRAETRPDEKTALAGLNVQVPGRGRGSQQRIG